MDNTLKNLLYPSEQYKNMYFCIGLHINLKLFFSAIFYREHAC